MTYSLTMMMNTASSGRCGDGEEEEDMEKHAVQVLALAHAYQVPWLKRACEGAIGARLTADSVVDVLQLAALCDAPRLHLRCTRLLAKEFAAVERTEAWRFLQENDPWQELQVLQGLHDADMVRIFFPFLSFVSPPTSRLRCVVTHDAPNRMEERRDEQPTPYVVFSAPVGGMLCLVSSFVQGNGGHGRASVSRSCAYDMAPVFSYVVGASVWGGGVGLAIDATWLANVDISPDLTSFTLFLHVFIWVQIIVT